MKTLPLITVSAGILLSLVLAGCSAPSAEESKPKPTATKEAGSKPANPLASMSEKEIDTVVAQGVTSSGQMLCDQLGPIPDESLPAALDSVISSLADKGMSPSQAKDLGGRVLNGSAEKFCPDQSVRIATALG